MSATTTRVVTVSACAVCGGGGSTYHPYTHNPRPCHAEGCKDGLIVVSAYKQGEEPPRAPAPPECGGYVAEPDGPTPAESEALAAVLEWWKSRSDESPGSISRHYAVTTRLSLAADALAAERAKESK